MLNDFRRGFATYLANFTRSNYHQHRTEPTETTKDFDEKLRQYLDLKPVDIILGNFVFLIIWDFFSNGVFKSSFDMTKNSESEIEKNIKNNGQQK